MSDDTFIVVADEAQAELVLNRLTPKNVPQMSNPIPTNAAEIIAAVEAADISKQDWDYDAVLQNPSIPDFWRGYLTYAIEEFGATYNPNYPEYRDEILCLMRRCWRITPQP